MDIAKRIIFFRTKKNLTVNRLANMAGISQNYLRDIELRKKNPTVETLSLLCDTFSISLRDFFDDGIMDSIRNDKVFSEIYRLLPIQRETLYEFLKALS